MSSVKVAEGTNAFDAKTLESNTVNITDMVLSHSGKANKSFYRRSTGVLPAFYQLSTGVLPASHRRPIGIRIR